MSGLTFDAGALIALERRGRAATLSVQRAARRDRAITVPTAVVVQVWRDGRTQALLARALSGMLLEPLDAELARVAGVLLGRSGTRDAIDAIVVASAARRGDAVLTSHPDDLQRLADHAPGVRVVGL